jgi:hypothetical protein
MEKRLILGQNHQWRPALQGRVDSGELSVLVKPGKPFKIFSPHDTWKVSQRVPTGYHGEN